MTQTLHPTPSRTLHHTLLTPGLLLLMLFGHLQGVHGARDLLRDARP
jgi:hypothetical protein